MTVPREVILDLLPLYASGEASAATRALVEEHLSRDPELARQARAMAAALPAVTPTLSTDVELLALQRTRHLLGVQRWLFGLAISLTSLALATRISFEDGHVRSVGLLLFEHPLPFGLCLAGAVAFWVAYVMMRRRLRVG